MTKLAVDPTDASNISSGTLPAGRYTDTVYTHPTTAGNKHIPTAGATDQVLTYSSSGTAAWADLAAGAQTYRSQFTVDRTTTGTQAITGVGFAPKAVFAIAARNCVRGYSIGQAAFTGNGHGCMFGDYNSVSGSVAFDNFLYRNDGNGSSTSPTIIAYGKISSWDSDGFTITKTISGAPTSNLIVYYTCIG